MPAPNNGQLAMLTVPQAFGMDALHQAMLLHWSRTAYDPYPLPTDTPDTQPIEWARQMSAAGGLGIAPSKSLTGTDEDPGTWYGDMARLGLPGTENSPDYQEPVSKPPAYGTPEHEAAFAQNLTGALDTNIRHLAAYRRPEPEPEYTSNTDDASRK